MVIFLKLSTKMIVFLFAHSAAAAAAVAAKSVAHASSVSKCQFASEEDETGF
jgi:hypothetical protein